MSARYYRHSGRISAPRLVLALALALAVAMGCGFLYAYAFAYIPIIGYVSFLLALGFGLAVGFVVNLAMVLAHVRNATVVTLVSLLVTSLGYYVSWAIWVHVVIGRGDIDIASADLATHPSMLWELIRAIAETGTWSMHGWTPSGGVLWVAWIVELGLIVVPAVMVARTALDDTVYCEPCGAWCVDRSPIDLAIADPAVLAQVLETNNLHAISEMHRRGDDDLAWMRLQITSCPTCQQTHTVSMRMVTFTYNDEGKAEEKADTYVDRLLIDRASAEQLGNTTALVTPV